MSSLQELIISYKLAKRTMKNLNDNVLKFANYAIGKYPKILDHYPLKYSFGHKKHNNNDDNNIELDTTNAPKKKEVIDLYKKLSLVFHPDRPTGSHEQFIKLNQYYEENNFIEMIEMALSVPDIDTQSLLTDDIIEYMETTIAQIYSTYTCLYIYKPYVDRFLKLENNDKDIELDHFIDDFHLGILKENIEII